LIHRTPFLLPLLYPTLTWRIPVEQPDLYLTFDDGPVPGATEFVLDELKKYQAKATFFCIGDNIWKHAEVFRKVVAHGHAVGNHTFNHLNGWKTSTGDYISNIQQCQQVITNGNVPLPGVPLFRPPYGRITRNQIKQLPDYRIIMWDVLSVDYDQRLSPERCLQNTIRATRPGSIIVFHDSSKAARNMMFALPRFLEHFTERGFTFNTLHAAL